MVEGERHLAAESELKRPRLRCKCTIRLLFRDKLAGFDAGYYPVEYTATANSSAGSSYRYCTVGIILIHSAVGGYVCSCYYVQVHTVQISRALW